MANITNFSLIEKLKVKFEKFVILDKKTKFFLILKDLSTAMVLKSFKH